MMHQASPTKTPAQIKAALKGTAEAVPGYGAETVGKGLVRAVQAIEALGPFGPINDPPSTLVTPVKPEPPAPPAPPVIPSPAKEAETGKSKGEKEQALAPKAKFKSHPAKLLKSRVGRVKVTFKFAANQQGSKFECSVDKTEWKSCGATFKPWLLLGPHEVRVRARGTSGQVGAVASYKFVIKLVA